MTEKSSKTEKRKKSSKRRSGSSDPKHRREEGAYLVAIRNESLNLTYRRLGLAAAVSVLAAVVSVGSFLAVTGKPTPPQYIPMTEDGRLLPLIPLNKPNLDDGAIGAFALKAVRDLNNYDYLGWKTQILRGQNYFTPEAWKAYYQEFESTNILNTVEARKMIVVAQPSGNVVIENRGLGDDGVYLWRVAVPLEIRYVDHLSEQGGQTASLSSKGKATLYIRRVPTTLSPQGIAIRAYQFENVEP